MVVVVRTDKAKSGAYQMETSSPLLEIPLTSCTPARLSVSTMAQTDQENAFLCTSATTTIALFRRAVGLGTEVRGAGVGGGVGGGGWRGTKLDT